MKLSKIFLTLILVAVVISVPVQAMAASWVTNLLDGSEIIPEGCRTGRQDRIVEVGPPAPGQTLADQSRPACGIPEIIQTAINITRIILGVMGSVALLMFTYGGIKFITSAGDRGKVQDAKSILTNATWGIVIILLSWTIVNFVVLAIAGGDFKQGAKIFDQPAANPPK